jgi:ABC-type Zn uptake system ZnuABC Zn-binding protein ZnuA
MTTSISKRIIALFVLFVFLAACAPQAVSTPEAEPTPGAEVRPLRVVATTNILADVVRQVGGDQIELQYLIPMGTDPHSYQPTPQDLATIEEADIVFLVGAGLEEYLDGVRETAGRGTRWVHLSEGIELIHFEDGHHDDDEYGHKDEDDDHDDEYGHKDEDDDHDDEDGHKDEDDHDDEDGHSHEDGDPHVWFDPNNVILWVQGIERVLSQMDGLNAATYAANAQAYAAQLEELDDWIKAQVAEVPQENRLIVTDHLLLGYFAERYGFTQVGAVFPGYSTMTEPSAQEMAALEDAIRELGVKAVFVGNTVNPQVSQRIAEDTGVQLVYFYTDSLSEEGGPAASYLDYIRYNVSVIVGALK